jgi:hypothetical protein
VRLTRCLLVVIFLAVSSGVAPVGAEEKISFICPAVPVHVVPASAKDQTLVCNAADKAHGFFRSHGIEIKRQIHIRLHQEEIQNHENHIGLYHAKKDLIDMVTLDHARHQCSEKPPFDIQMNEGLYSSFVVHEISHAIADQNFGGTQSLIVQEYLAYVTQFSTMEPNVRSKILQEYSVAPFAGVDDMSLTYYELDPNAFGVKVFLHYQSLADKSGFIQGLLSGSIKQNAE